MTTNIISYESAEDMLSHHGSTRNNQLKTSDTDLKAAAHPKVTPNINSPPSKEIEASDENHARLQPPRTRILEDTFTDGDSAPFSA